MSEENRLKPIISDVFHLSEAARAQMIMEESKQFGKLVLKP
jgi:NADPH:quinone reductase-like Zn-dependent oxidoreductase